MQASIDSLLADSPEAKRRGLPAEEWAIHAYEGFGDINEFDSLLEVWSAHEALRNVYEDEEEALLIYVKEQGGWKYASDFQDMYLGKYDSEVDFVRNWLSESGQIDELPDWAQRYFDYEAYAQDAFLTDLIYCDGYIFWNK